MKNFIAMMIIAICFLCTGCKDNAPVNFQLDVSGNVYEAKTNVSADFNTHVTNVTPITFSIYNAKDYVKLSQSYEQPYNWILDNVRKPIVEQAGKNGDYDVTVTGYISWRGLKFMVDEHWKNHEQNDDY